MLLPLLLSLALSVTPNFGSEPQKVTLKFRLDQPTEYPICVWFDADGIQWKSCRDGNKDQLSYERTYTLDAGTYHIWIEADGIRSTKATVVIQERIPQ